MNDQEYFSELSNIFYRNRKGWFREAHPGVFHVLNTLRNTFVRRTTRYGGAGFIFESVYPTKDIHQLALEQPHIPADGDKQRVAYWQSDEKQKRGLATVTSLGKYLRRHFPTLPDDQIRDIVGLYDPVRYEFWDTTEGIVKAAQEGPTSCMQWDETDEDDEDWENHPYEAYDPAYGWKICVALKGTRVVGRALVNGETFVRAYGMDLDGGICTNDSMVAWLKSKGFKHTAKGWPEGLKLRKVPHHCSRFEFMVPYLDGNAELACVRETEACLVIDYSGKFECRETDGGYSEVSYNTCDSCDRDFTETPNYVDVDFNRCICDNCISSYQTVRGRNRNLYSILENDAVQVGSWYYDPAYLEDNGIVELYDGNYASENDCVYVNDEWYSNEDVGRDPTDLDWLVCLTGDSQYELRENCSYCQLNREWYLTDELGELNDGTFVHLNDLENFLLDATPYMLSVWVDAEEGARVMSDPDYQHDTPQMTASKLSAALAMLDTEQPCLEGA